MTKTFAPRLRATHPDNWYAKESVTLLAPDGQANVIISSEPLDPGISAQQYAETQGELLRTEFDGYREERFQPQFVMGRRPGYLRHFEWTPPDGVPVTQIQVYFASSGRGYTATATTPSSQYRRFEHQLVQIFEGLSIDG
jgi:hypothetical protein